MLNKSSGTATSLAQQLQQQAQLLQLQQQLQQQQQQPQALAAAAPDMEQQLAAAAETLSAVANMLVATRTDARMRANGIHARSLVFQQQQQQQQQQQPFAAPVVSSPEVPVPESGSRTASPNSADAGAAAAAVGLDAHCSAFEAAVGAAVGAAAAAAAAGTAAADPEFDSFLEALLSAEDVPASSAEASLSSGPSCSSGSASLATTFPPFLGQPGAAAHSGSRPALLAPAAVDLLPMQASLAGMQMPLPGCAGNLGFAAPTGFHMSGQGFVSLGAGAVSGLATSSCSTGSAASLGGAFVGVDQRHRTAEHLQSLNAVLQQVQSSVLALAQNIQGMEAAKGMQNRATTALHFM
jgi:hypothetical protein